MKKFFKQLFCDHNWVYTLATEELLKSLGPYERRLRSYMLWAYGCEKYCTKCKKVERIIG